MALYEAVSAHFESKPIVILDDVFAQLDEARRDADRSDSARAPLRRGRCVGNGG